ncbi:lytic transglycosylase domain-containing protein [Mycobacterium sp. IDR2000157661]|uniref:lytic transglycosylase domain-containing protein n=1 Tax=Mycobacterium sp. IDR2000157661 TaxID=2867005 RepID=UPI001EEA7809|nr:lytic transglycosylase domain-containing protein [Mycobacterium sp. IDR2000157661]
MPVLALVLVGALGACSQPIEPSPPSNPPSSSVEATATPTAGVPAPSEQAPAQPRLASDPVRMADDLVADERTLRAESEPEAVLVAAARRQQRAYRVLARHPDWDAVVRPRVPAQLLDAFDRNINARRQLARVNGGQPPDTMPAWRIVEPAPSDELLGYYRKAQDATGVGWSFLAAINLIETGFGRVAGTSTAGAQGPMQFLPSTFAAYGGGGDINSPHDSIMAAGRHLAANGFGHAPERALFRYNNSDRYVEAVTDYATVMAADPAAFAAYHRWDIYYLTTAGDIVLPLGYAETTRIPVQDYLAHHPQ